MDKILQAYNLDTPFPTEWGYEGPDSDASGMSGIAGDQSQNALTHQLLSSVNKASSRAPADERDPLGLSGSIVGALRTHGIHVDEDPALRAKYMLSSPKFNPRQYLRDVHGGSSYTDLKRAHDLLQRTISSQNDDLRTLVDDDYEQFVTAKRHLDEVMSQLSLSGIVDDSGSIVKLSGLLDEATNKFTLVMRPLEELGTQRARYQTSLNLLDEHKYLFDLPATLAGHVASSEHHDFMRDYRRGLDELADLGDLQNPPELRRVASLIAGHVQKIALEYRQTLWSQLMNSQVDKNYSQYFDMLIDLGVEANPAFEWMQHQATLFEKKLESFFSRLRADSANTGLETGAAEQDYDVMSWIKHIVVGDTPVGGDIGDNSAEASSADKPRYVDSVPVTELWTRLSDLISEFRDLVARATGFWEECAAILGGSKRLNAQLRLTGQQERDIKLRFVSLTRLMGQRIEDWVSMSPNSALPVATNYETTSRDALAFAPANANSLSTARYLGRILENLIFVGQQVADFMGTHNEYAKSLELVSARFLNVIGRVWVRDSAKFGAIQNWDRGSAAELQKVTVYFQRYHGWMLERIHAMIKNYQGGNRHQIVTDLLQSVADALSQSIYSLHRYLADKESEAVNTRHENYEALQPHSLDQDSKVLVSMATFAYIQSSIVPQIFAEFSAIFQGASTQEVQKNVSSAAEDLKNKAFDLYVRKKKTSIANIISQELLANHERYLANSVPAAISNYIYESLITLVEVHAKFLELNPEMLSQVLTALHHQLLSSFLSSIRELDQIGKYGVLQFVADVEFVRSVLNNLRTEISQKTVQLIYDSLKDSSLDKSIWMGTNGPRDHIRQVIETALQQEYLAFVCFNSVSAV